MTKMTKFEEFILTDFIPKNVKMNGDSIYEISLDKIDKLNLTLAQKELILKILKAYSIRIISLEVEKDEKEKITKADRSPLVRDYNYGAVTEIDNKKNDVPVYAELEYDKSDTPIFENYEQLEQYLDKEFIPKTIQTKKYYDDETEDIEYYSSIQFNKILKLKLSEQEIKHVIEYLESMDIRVAGINSTLDSEFDNYDYITTYKTQHLPEVVSWEEQKTLFEEFSKTNDNLIFKKIVEANLRLVPFITSKLAYTYKVDINELNSYGYEALIDAVNKYDLSLGNRFSTYAYIAIRRNVTRNLPVLLGFKNLGVYKDFVMATEAIKDLYAENGLDEEIAVSEIIDLIQNVNNYGKLKTKNVNLEIQLGTAEDIDDLAESDDYVDDYTLERSILVFDSNKILMELLDTLTSREKFVLLHRFGFKDGKVNTLEEVGAMMGLTRERIRQIEAKALRKLRHPSRSGRLANLLDGFDTYIYDEDIHFRKL